MTTALPEAVLGLCRTHVEAKSAATGEEGTCSDCLLDGRAAALTEILMLAQRFRLPPTSNNQYMPLHRRVYFLYVLALWQDLAVIAGADILVKGSLTPN